MCTVEPGNPTRKPHADDPARPSTPLSTLMKMDETDPKKKKYHSIFSRHLDPEVCWHLSVSLAYPLASTVHFQCHILCCFLFLINFTASYEFYPCTYSINLWWRVLWSWAHWRFVDTPEYCPLFHSQMLAGMPFIHPSTSHLLPLIQGQARVAVGQAR